MLLMLLPLKMVENILDERDTIHQSELDNIAEGWGDDQTVAGPILVVPFVEHITSVETITDSQGDSRVVSKDVFTSKTMVLLPEELHVDAKLNERHRKEGKQSSQVYDGDLTLSGVFNLDALPRENNKITIRWDKAWLAVGLTDIKAIDSTSPLRWDDKSAKLESGTRLKNILPNGFHASMASTSKINKRPEFKVQLSFKGKNRFSFVPVGESTTAYVESAWPHPSFQGGVLPKSKIISSDGFSAEWNITHLSRNYPQSWLIGEDSYQLDELTAGVDLFTSVLHTSKVNRVVKYGALFIGLTFLSFLTFEVSVKSRVHIIQYAVVGLSISLFYLLLISLSEHFSFMMAYVYATSAILSIITLYTMAVFRSFAKGGFILLLLGSLYTALYFILQMEAHALLAGSSVLFFVVVLLMMATRNIHRGV